MGADHYPDYAEIARLEQELGLAPRIDPGPCYGSACDHISHQPVGSAPVEHLEPSQPRVPANALYVCTHCGNRVRAGATFCNHCGGDTWRRDDD